METDSLPSHGLNPGSCDSTEPRPSTTHNASWRPDFSTCPPIETIGAVCELETESDYVDHEEVQNVDTYTHSDLVEFILNEHNYAKRCENVIRHEADSISKGNSVPVIDKKESGNSIIPIKRGLEDTKISSECKPIESKSEDELPSKKLRMENSVENGEEGNEIKSPKDLSTEKLNVTTPVRRSRRQIEKIERKQTEKDIVSCLDTAISEALTNRTEKIGTKKEKETSSKDSFSEMNRPENEVKIVKSDKNFSDVKKRHVQIILYDCLKDGTVKDKNIYIPKPASQDSKEKDHVLSESLSEKDSNGMKPITDSLESNHTNEKQDVVSVKTVDEKVLPEQGLNESNLSHMPDQKNVTVSSPELERMQEIGEMLSDSQPLLEKCTKEPLLVISKENETLSNSSSNVDVNSEKLTLSQEKQSNAQPKNNKRLVNKILKKKTTRKSTKIEVLKKRAGTKGIKDAISSKRATNIAQNSRETGDNKPVSQSDNANVEPKQKKSPKGAVKVDKKCQGRKKSDSQLAVSINDASEVQPSLMDSDDKVTSSSTPSKCSKKKVMKKEITRLPLNENEPALFSTPDVMVKVKTDDSSFENCLTPKLDVNPDLKLTLDSSNVTMSDKVLTDQNFNTVKSLNADSIIRQTELTENNSVDNIIQETESPSKNLELASTTKLPALNSASDALKENVVESTSNKCDNDSGYLCDKQSNETNTAVSPLKQTPENTNLTKTEELPKGQKQNLVPKKLPTTVSQLQSFDENTSKCNQSTSSPVSKTSVPEKLSEKKSSLLNDSSNCDNTPDNSVVPVSKEATIRAKVNATSNSYQSLDEANIDHETSEAISQSEKDSSSEQKYLSVSKTENSGDKLNSSNKKEDSNQPVRKSVRERKATKKVVETRVDDSEASSESEEDDDDSYEEDDPTKLWCICRKPHNSRFMIQCDKCEDWFHGSCVGVTKQLGMQLEKQKKEWHCPNCTPKDVPKVAPTVSNEKMNNLKKNQVPEKRPSIGSVRSQEVQVPKVESSGGPKSNPVSSTELVKGQAIKPTVEVVVKKIVNPVNAKVLKVIKPPTETPEKVLKQLVMKKSPKIPGKNIVHKESPTLKDIPGSTKEYTPIKPSPVNGKKSFATPKEKKTFRKKINCTNCKLEAMPNSCYCSNACLEQYTEKCLNDMRSSSAGIKNTDFDNQRLVVLDRLRGSVITSEHGPTVKEIVSWLKMHPSYMITSSSSSGNNAKKEVMQKKDHNSNGKVSEASSSIAKKSDSNSNSEKNDKKPDDEEAKATVRLNVRKTLKNILWERCKNSDDIQMPEDDVEKIANKIEKELQYLFKDNSFKYRAKYRSLMFNIKDPRNQGLFRKILTGVIQPDRLVRMSPEELASLELAKWREQENQHVLDMIKRVQLEHQSMGGSLLKKTHKGEVEIETFTESFVEKDVPKLSTKEISEDSEPEKEMTKDTTHLHRSHLFDLNCKICTGKVVPPPDDSSSKRVRVAHSISVDVSSSNSSDAIEKSDKPVSKPEDSNGSSNGEDSVDQEPSSTVSLKSPDSSTKPHHKRTKAKASSVWKGFIIMQDVAKFVTVAYKVSGKTDQLQLDLPDIIQVCGRIIPDQVWEYLGKIKQSGNKELIVIRFQPANEEESNAYNGFYSYLSSRKRYGVVSNFSKKIKDFYILPLAATSPVPMVLVPFDGPGLPSPRPPLLLGVIVKHKSKQIPVPMHVKPAIVKKPEIESSDASYTPPHEPRSYTPPLPALPLSNNKVEDEKKLPSIEAISTGSLLENASEDERSNSHQMTSIRSVDTPTEKDEDKPYDPEQDIPCISSVVSNDKETLLAGTPTTDNLEDHKKILDALTRQVEETDRQLKQLISQPEVEDVTTTNVPPLDINSIAGSGMSSFLDLPETLQDIFNNVRLKSHEKDPSLDGDKKLGKDKSETEQNQILQKVLNIPEVSRTEHKLSSQATPPSSAEDKDSNLNCVSDPRIKLRTNFQDAFSSNVNISPTESKSPHSDDSPLIMPISSTWSSDEPAPPGLETELSPPKNAVYSFPPETTSVMYGSSYGGPTVEFQPPPSFQPQLPHGFSVHKPPPTMTNFLPPQMISPSYPPPIPVPVLPSEIIDNQVPEAWHSLPPPVSLNHWEKPSETAQYYSSADSTNYQSQSENMYINHSGNKHWGPSRYSSQWNKNSSRNRRDNHRGRGGRLNGPYHRNHRN